MEMRKSIARCRPAAAVLCISALGVALIACEPMDRSQFAVNCNAEAGIERDIEYSIATKQGYFTFEIETKSDKFTIGDQANAQNNTSFFCFQDGTAEGYPANAAVFPGGNCQMPNVEYIDDGNAFCDAVDNDVTVTADANGATVTTPVQYPRHRGAFAVRAGGNQFYGVEIGNWNWNTGQFPSFIPDGIGVWARSDVNSDKFVYIYLSDYRSGAPSDTVPGTTYSPGLATKAKGLEAGCMPTGLGNTINPNINVTVASTDPNVQTSSSSLTMVSNPGQCGNRWRALLETSENWELHLLPFELFYQDLQPNRVPDGITRSIDWDPTKEGPEPAPFYQIAFNIGRGQNVSLYIDEIFFYRKKPVGTTN